MKRCKAISSPIYKGELYEINGIKALCSYDIMNDQYILAYMHNEKTYCKRVNNDTEFKAQEILMKHFDEAKEALSKQCNDAVML